MFQFKTLVPTSSQSNSIQFKLHQYPLQVDPMQSSSRQAADSHFPSHWTGYFFLQITTSKCIQLSIISIIQHHLTTRNAQLIVIISYIVYLSTIIIIQPLQRCVGPATFAGEKKHIRTSYPGCFCSKHNVERSRRRKQYTL